MINKTFNSDSTDGRALDVGRNGERPWLNIHEFDFENTMFMLAPSDAPALALAILEAAGVDLNESWSGVDPYGTPSHLGWVGGHLRAYVRQLDKAAAEAKERAELEAEALELRNEFTGQTATEWAYPATTAKEGWLAVARRAREMRNEKKEPTND